MSTLREVVRFVTGMRCKNHLRMQYLIKFEILKFYIDDLRTT